MKLLIHLERSGSTNAISQPVLTRHHCLGRLDWQKNMRSYLIPNSGPMRSQSARRCSISPFLCKAQRNIEDPAQMAVGVAVRGRCPCV